MLGRHEWVGGLGGRVHSTSDGIDRVESSPVVTYAVVGPSHPVHELVPELGQLFTEMGGVIQYQ